MQLLIKTALTLFAFFAMTFIIIKMSGVLTLDDIKQGFEQLKNGPGYVIGGFVVVLLFADLFIAIPTMTVILLSGYFLGFYTAFIYSLVGVLLAASVGYVLSNIMGDKILSRIEPDKENRQNMYSLFQQHGMWVLILSRAMPILPEVSACLAGVCKMPVHRFLLGWSIGTLPYLMIVTYAGSASDFDNPYPALITAIGLTVLLWTAWLWFIKKQRKFSTG